MCPYYFTLCPLPTLETSSGQGPLLPWPIYQLLERVPHGKDWEEGVTAPTAPNPMPNTQLSPRQRCLKQALTIFPGTQNKILKLYSIDLGLA